MMSMMMSMMGSMAGKGAGPSKGGGFGNKGKADFSSTGSGNFNASGDFAICSVHGKKRTKSNLVDDGAGGMSCSPGFECNGGTRMTMQEGDWACPSCSDIQFARNTVCRKCGTPKPTDGGGRWA